VVLQAMASTAERPDVSGITALVIDDHIDSVQLLVAALEPFGVRVIASYSVQEAQQTMSAITPDIVICDLHLPGESGIDFIRWLRSRPREGGGRIPAIAVTFFYERFGVRETREAGFDMFVRKPLDPMEIVHAVAVLTRG
jgi:CheY-like chemotaxis protein